MLLHDAVGAQRAEVGLLAAGVRAAIDLKVLVKVPHAQQCSKFHKANEADVSRRQRPEEQRVDGRAAECDAQQTRAAGRRGVGSIRYTQWVTVSCEICGVR